MIRKWDKLFENDELDLIIERIIVSEIKRGAGNELLLFIWLWPNSQN